MGCDLHCACNKKHVISLSVSSNGSNGLRHGRCALSENRRATFSILERIEWAATITPIYKEHATDELSVSSNGSNGLRRDYDDDEMSCSTSFSILERIEWAATVIHLGSSTSAHPLSVSSNGSNGLRLRPSAGLRFLAQAFQYPRTDRMGCDHTVLAIADDTVPPFSILERIEWAATVQADEGQPPAGHFQYPRTDRMGCDTTMREEITRMRESFSILERIEWAATSCQCLEWIRTILFQYPRTDRMGCDSCLRYTSSCCFLLSVSSNGSNGLRQLLPADTWRVTAAFSILERIEWAATGVGARCQSNF